MRLLLPWIDFEIDLDYRSVNVLIIEKPSLFSDIVSSLYDQTSGGDGSLLLSEKDKVMRFDKAVEFISNPFAINCNDKKIVNRIYKELTEVAQEKYLDEIANMNAVIVTVLDSVCNCLTYPLRFELSVDLNTIWKCFGIQIDEQVENRMDYLITYIKLVHQVNHVRVFVFLNLRQYFSYEQLQYLYQACLYEQVCIIDFECAPIGNRILQEKYTIIDKDLCIIKLD